MDRSRTLLVLLLSAAGLLGFLYLRTADEAATDPESAGTAVVDRTREREELAPQAAGPSAEDAESAAPARTLEVSPGGPVGSPGRPAVLDVTIRSASTGEPIVRVPVTLRRAEGETTWKIRYIERNVGWLSRDLRSYVGPKTDQAGKATVRIPGGTGPLAVSVRGTDRLHDRKTISIGELSPGTRHELLIELETAPDLEFHAIVLDDESGEPVSGADVRLTSSAWKGQGKVVEVLEEVRTAGDGRFAFARQSWEDLYVEIEAPGYSTRHEVPFGEHGTRSTAREIRLTRGAELFVRIADAGGTALDEYVVKLFVNSLFLGAGAFVSGQGIEQSRSCDPQGECRFEGVPSSVPVQVSIEHRGEPLSVHSRLLRFDPGETKRETWSLGTGARISGVLNWSGGGAPEQVSIVLVEKRTGVMTLLSPGAFSHQTFSTRNDGSFEFLDVPLGRWIVGVEDEDLGCSVSTCELTVGSGTDEYFCELVAACDRFVSGTVLDAKGAPVARASVSATQSGQSSRNSTTCDEVGRFRIGPFQPGEVHLHVRPHRESGAGAAVQAVASDFVSSVSVTAEAGDSDVVVTLPRGGILVVSLVDAITGKPLKGTASLRPTDMIRRAASGAWYSKDASTLTFDGIPAGEYILSATAKEDRIAVLPSVVVAEGQEPARYLLSMVGAGTLRYRVVAGSLEGHPYLRISRNGELMRESALVVGQSHEESLPPGTYDVALFDLVVSETDQLTEELASTLAVTILAGEATELVHSQSD